MRAGRFGKENRGQPGTSPLRVQKVGVVITPEQLAASGSEEGHGCAIMQWLALNPMPDSDLIHHIPNGGDRTPSVGARMKAQGVRRGVPDYHWPVKRGLWPGLWIELKTPKQRTATDGGRSKEQVVWHKRLIEQGDLVVLAFGWQAAVHTLKMYHRGWTHMPIPVGGDAVFLWTQEYIGE